jgi:hypothetical protein
MTAQLGFIQAPAAREKRQPSARIVTTVDGKRLGQQCAKILSLLRDGPQTNFCLSSVALKYTSRISDLRLLGYVIDCERLNGGLMRYHLVGEPKRGDA